MYQNFPRAFEAAGAMTRQRFAAARLVPMRDDGGICAAGADRDGAVSRGLRPLGMWGL